MAFGDLFIPHKTTQSPVSQPDYGNDMRAIEIWAKQLTSGGVGAIYFQMQGTPGTPSSAMVAWGSGTIGATATGTPQQLLSLPGAPAAAVQSSGTIANAVIGSGGFVYIPQSIGAGKNIWGSARFQAPNFTGPTNTIGLTLVTQAVSMDGLAPASDWFTVASHQINLTSGSQHGLIAGDYNAATITGADLQFASGVLSLKSTAALKPYLVGWSVRAVWDTTTNFQGFAPS